MKACLPHGSFGKPEGQHNYQNDWFQGLHTANLYFSGNDGPEKTLIFYSDIAPVEACLFYFEVVVYIAAKFAAFRDKKKNKKN